MGETTQTERNGSRHTASFGMSANNRGIVTDAEFLLRLLNDADRLATIERRVRELAGSIREDAGDPDGNPARTYRAGFDNGYYSGRTKSANELERLIDAPGEDQP